MGTLQLFGAHFIDGEVDGHKPAAGDLYWVPVSEIREVPLIMDVKRATPEEHIATHFEIKEIASNHFQKRDRLPVHKLRLDDTQELMVNRAKKRICVVLSDSPPSVTAEEFKSGEQRRLAQKSFNARNYLLSPTYSVSTPVKPTSFGPELVARIRALQYFHLHCLPDPKDSGVPGSVIRLDHAFHGCLGRGCEYVGKSLHPEVFELLRSQFAVLTGNIGGEIFDEVQAIVGEALSLS